MKRKIAAILVCCLAFGMTACGGAKGGNADNDSKVYAVEAGSAGATILLKLYALGITQYLPSVILLS